MFQVEDGFIPKRLPDDPDQQNALGTQRNPKKWFWKIRGEKAKTGSENTPTLQW